MNKYNPDRWVLVRIKKDEDEIVKILAGWSGSYLSSDYWKISSGVIEIEETDEAYLIKNHSGSIYSCRKGRSGFTALTSGLFNKVANTEGMTIEVVDIQDMIKELEDEN